MSRAAASSSSSVTLEGSVDGGAERIAAASPGRPVAPAEASHQHGGNESVAIGVTARRVIEQVETPGGAEQQRRRVSRAALHRRHSTAQHINAHRAKLVKRPALCDPGKPQRVLRRPGEVLRLCGGQRALGPAPRVERQIHRAFEKGSRRRLTPARPRASGRTLELIRDRLIWTDRGEGAVPCPPIRISLGVCHLGDRRMRSSPLPQRPRRVRGRPDERMPELNPSAELTQPRLLSRYTRLDPNPEPLGGPPYDGWLTERVGRRDEQEEPGLLGQRREPATETVLNPV